FYRYCIFIIICIDYYIAITVGGERVIKIEHLSFSYPDSKLILDDINIDIYDHEITVIIGKTGSGKTTLLKHLKHELKPAGKQEGTIDFQGIDSEKIGYVFQNPHNQIVEDYVYHEIAFGLENLGIERKIMKNKIAEIVQYFHLEDIYDKRTSELSGGEKQLVNLAAIMVMQPCVLLLDEPLAQLDPHSQEQFISILKKLHHDFGLTIVMITHQLDNIYEDIDKLIVLDKGKVLIQGKPKDVAKELRDNDLLSFFPSYIQLLSKMRLPLNTSFYQTKTLINPLNIKQRTYEEHQTCIHIKHLYASYDKDILYDISTNIPKQEILCILGSNGSGKTTLLRCLINNMKYQGQINIKGKIGYLPQEPLLLINKDSVKEEIKDDYLIQYFGFESLLDKHPYDLSGGQQQLLGIMKLLSNNNDTLLLDEPTKGLDPLMEDKLGNYLEQLVQQGKTIIIVSHDLEFCGTYATMLSMLFHHQLSDLLRPYEFFSNHYFYTTKLAKLTKDDNLALSLRDVML
ncbi:MAG: ATP-binding cassette domain-containing protein, partial [Erysipelotrichaceae bacterium]|nr:ATP-binding cassette domain-containing protein [Erysipelotrichaceae bacterium]